MAKNDLTVDATQTAVDLVNAVKSLSAADLAKLLAEARRAEKEKEAELSALPSFAFAAIIADENGHFDSVMHWSGKAADADAAMAVARADVQSKLQGGASVYSLAARPLPLPRGRKAATPAPVDQAS